MESLSRTETGQRLIGSPETMLDESKKIAEVLVKLVRERKLTQTYGKREHVMVDAWLTLASWFGITASCPHELTKYFEIESTGEEGFEATAQIYTLAGEPLNIEASAMCTNFEENWGVRPKYEKGEDGKRKRIGEVVVPRFQLRSMAQTRAIAKVLSIRYRHIVVLAGFDTTPAEEMTGREKSKEREPGEEAQAAGPKKISDPQRKRIFGIANSVNMPKETIVQTLNKHGFALAADVTVDKYEALCKEIQDWKAK